MKSSEVLAENCVYAARLRRQAGGGLATLAAGSCCFITGQIITRSLLDHNQNIVAIMEYCDRREDCLGLLCSEYCH